MTRLTGWIAFTFGGGIDIIGTLTVIDSTFLNNHTGEQGFNGGAISAGTLTVINSTFYDNHASGGGGAIFGTRVIVINSTFYQNGSSSASRVKILV